MIEAISITVLACIGLIVTSYLYGYRNGERSQIVMPPPTQPVPVVIPEHMSAVAEREVEAARSRVLELLEENAELQEKIDAL